MVKQTIAHGPRGPLLHGSYRKRIKALPRPRVAAGARHDPHNSSFGVLSLIAGQF